MSKQSSILLKQHSTLSKKIVSLVTFENVASTLLQVWTGLQTVDENDVKTWRRSVDVLTCRACLLL